MSVEVVNEVSPANSTVYLNCTLDGNITWFYNDEKVDLSNENYKVEHASLRVTVGEVHSCVVYVLKMFLFRGF